MIGKIKKWIGIGVPGGWDDVAVRTVKVGVMAFSALLVKEGVANADWAALQAAADAAWVAGATLVLNAVLKWAAT
jgi:hypothetical protein